MYFETLKNSFIQILYHFPQKSEDIYAEYKTIFEEYIKAFGNILENKKLDSLMNFGRSIDKIFVILNYLSRTTVFSREYETNNDRYRALIRASPYREELLFQKIFTVARCVYKIRSEFEHNAIKNEIYYSFFQFIITILLQMFIITDYNCRIEKDANGNFSRVVNLIASSYKIEDKITPIINSQFIQKFSKILRKKGAEVKEILDNLLIPPKYKEFFKDYNKKWFSILNSYQISQKIFELDIITKSDFEKYKGLQILFPFQIQSEFLLQNKLYSENIDPDESFRFAGPQIMDFTVNSYIYIPSIAQKILTSFLKSKLIAIQGKSGLGKSSLARIIGYFYSKKISQIEFSEPFKNIPQEYIIPVYYLDYFSVEYWRVSEALNSFKVLHVIKNELDYKPLIIVDNAHRMPENDRRQLYSLQSKFNILIVQKPQSIDESEEKRQDNKLYRPKLFELDKNEKYISELMKGILLKTDPGLNPEYYIPEILNRPRTIFDLSSQNNGSLEENLWTITFIAKIIIDKLNSPEKPRGIHIFLTDFQVFNQYVKKFIGIRYDNYLVHCRKNNSPLQASQEFKVKQHFELSYLFLSFLSQFEIQIEKSFLIRLQEKLPKLEESLIITQLKNSDFDSKLMIEILEFLVSKGEIYKTESVDKDIFYSLPHQKLSIILKNSLLYPYSKKEIVEFQQYFFELYLKYGKNIGSLSQSIYEQKGSSTINEQQYYRLFLADSEKMKDSVERDFYYKKFIAHIPIENLQDQILHCSLSQLSLLLSNLAPIFEEEANFYQDYKDDYLKAIPPELKTIISHKFNSIFPGEVFIDGIFQHIFQRNLNSPKNSISFKELDTLHSLWYHYSNKKFSFEDFLKENITYLKCILNRKVLEDLLRIYGYYLADEKKRSGSRQFEINILDILGVKLVNCFPDDLVLRRKDDLLKVLNHPKYGEIIFKFLEQLLKNELHQRQPELFIQFLKDLINTKISYQKYENLYQVLFSNEYELITALKSIIDKLNPAQLGTFLDVAVNISEKNQQVEELFAKIITHFAHDIRNKIKKMSFNEFFRHFLVNFALKFLDPEVLRLKVFFDITDTKHIANLVKNCDFNSIKEMNNVYHLLEDFDHVLNLLNSEEIKVYMNNQINSLLEKVEKIKSIEILTKQLYLSSVSVEFSIGFKILFIEQFLLNKFEYLVDLLVNHSIFNLIKFFQRLNIQIRESGALENLQEQYLGMETRILQEWKSSGKKIKFISQVMLPKIAEAINQGYSDILLDFQNIGILRCFIEDLAENLYQDVALLPFCETSPVEIVFYNESNQIATKSFNIPLFVAKSSETNIRENQISKLIRLYNYYESRIQNKELVYFTHDNIISMKTKLISYIDNARSYFLAEKFQNSLEEISLEDLNSFLSNIYHFHPSFTREIIIQNYNHILKKYQGKNKYWISISWVFFDLLFGSYDSVKKQLIEEDLSKILMKFVSSLSFIEFVFLNVISYSKFKDINRSSKVFIKLWDNFKEIFLSERGVSLKEFLIALKIVYPMNEVNFMEYFFRPQLLFNAQMMFDPFFSQHQSDYFFSFSDILNIELLKGRNHLINNAWNDKKYQEYFITHTFNRLFSFFFQENPDLNTLIILENESFASFHSLILYQKFFIILELENKYISLGEKPENRNTIFKNLLNGNISRFSDDFGKKRDACNFESTRYIKINKYKDQLIDQFQVNIQIMFNKKHIHDSFLNNFDFRDFLIFCNDFDGFFSSIRLSIVNTVDLWFRKNINNLEITSNLNFRNLLFFLLNLRIYYRDQPEKYLRIFNEYKKILAGLFLNTAPYEIQMILFGKFDTEFKLLLLDALEDQIIDLLEQENPFWNMGNWLSSKDKPFSLFLNKFGEEFKEILQKPRIDDNLLI